MKKSTLLIAPGLALSLSLLSCSAPPVAPRIVHEEESSDADANPSDDDQDEDDKNTDAKPGDEKPISEDEPMDDGDDTPTPTPNPTPTPDPTPTPTPDPTPTPTPDPTPTPTPDPMPEVPATLKGNVSITYSLAKTFGDGSHSGRGHVRAAWITGVSDEPDSYIKTLEVLGKIRYNHLRRWNYFSATGPDVTTGATASPLTNSPISVKLSWDLKDAKGALVKPGKYNLWLEVTTGNTTELGSDIRATKSISTNGSGYAYTVIPFELTTAGGKTENSSTAFSNVVITHTSN